MTYFNNALIDYAHLPDKRLAKRWVNRLYDWMFQISSEYRRVEGFQEGEKVLKAELGALLKQIGYDAAKQKEQVGIFFKSLPALHQQLLGDLESYVNFDPAAKCTGEIVISYPGFYAGAVYRISHQLLQQQIPYLGRLLSELAHSRTGIDINPGAQIGNNFMIDHGTGTVVGETAIIGNNVKLYQGVTLGSVHVGKEMAGKKRQPTIEDNVIIYANATILGGKTVVGKNSVIGGNVWLTRSVPPYSLVYNKSEVVVVENPPYPEPINFII